MLLATRASTLDPATRTVTTEVGDQLHYGGGLVLATGAQPVRLGLPGEDLDGVYYLRTVDDAERLRAAISRAESMVVLGGGYRAEVAASADGHPGDPPGGGRHPLDQAVGPEMGRFFDLPARPGWSPHHRTRAERLEGGEQVEAVVLPDGTRLHADLVVIGVGVRPDTDLAERSGLPVDNGILVDQQLRAADGVLAAGDVANAEHHAVRADPHRALGRGPQPGAAGRPQPGRGGRALRPRALLLLRPVRPVAVVPGPRPGMGRAGRSGQPRGRRAPVRRLVPARRRARAALIVNDWDAEDPVREVIRGQPVDPARLADRALTWAICRPVDVGPIGCGPVRGRARAPAPSGGPRQREGPQRA